MLADEERTLMKSIRQRQLRFLGYTIREESIEKLAIEGKVEGKRARGRQRLTYMDGLTSVVVGDPGLSRKKTMQAIKSPCPFGSVGYLDLAELLISFYILVFITTFDKHIDVIYQHHYV